MPRKRKSKKIEWEKPTCDNCGGKKYKVFLDNITTWEHEYKFREVKCEKCGLVYLSPRPKKEFISRFYSTKTYWGTNLSSDEGKSKELKNRFLYFGRVYRNILKRKKKGSVFDVGFGKGLFLTYFKEIGWKIGGNELSGDAVKYAQRVFGLKDLKSGSIEDIRFKKNLVDVVTFNSSLEHLYSPKIALKKTNEMLKRGGLMVITVPNLDSLGFLIFKKHWLGLHPPKHLYHFTTETLTKMLDNVGLKVEEIDYWSWNHSFYSLFESFRYMISPRFKLSGQVSVDEIKKKSNNTQGSNIIRDIIKTAGILFAISFAAVFTILGSYIKKGEVITVYARKN